MTRFVSLYVNSKVVVDLACETVEQAVFRLTQRLNYPASPSGPETIAFMNMCNFEVAHKDPKALSAFTGIDYVYPDGVALQIARATLNLSSFERVTGTDLVTQLLVSSGNNVRVFLLGGTPELLTACASGFLRRFPSANLVGTHHGYFGSANYGTVVMEIAAAKPDLLLIGMGTPTQEMWLTANRHRLPVKLAICVGGLFHYWADDIRRAPKIVQRLGLEWSWILAQQPHKLRRYFTGSTFFTRWLIHRYRTRPR